MASSLRDKLVPSVLLNSTLRFTLLRIVCISQILLIIEFLLLPKSTNYYYIEFLVVYAVIFVHHFASAFGPKLSFPGLLDFLLILAELSALVYVTLPTIKAYRSVVQRLDRDTISILVISIINFLLLSSLALLRIVEALKRGGKYLINRYDVTGARWTSGPTSGMGNLSGAAAATNGGFVNFLLNGIYVLFGRSLWKEVFSGEKRWTIITRGVLAAVFITIIALFAVEALIIQPLRETALLPVQESRSTALPYDFTTSEVSLNVVVAKPQFYDSGEFGSDFSPAVRVTSYEIDDRSETPCFAVDSDRMFSDPRPDTNLTIDAVRFQCPLSYSAWWLYNVVVVVNFTMLHIQPNSTINKSRSSVQVMLGYINDTRGIYERTPPTVLIPGVNLVGITNFYIRQTLKKPTVSAFGLFDSVYTFWTSEIAQIWPDPDASSTSTSIPRSTDIGTIRIILNLDFSESRIIQDHRNKSVLSGFSSVGGLWTVLAGIFGALFGSSIMRVLFKKKSISVTGMAHGFEKEAIRDACLKGYPRLESDLQLAPKDKGLLTFISDHIIDFEFLARDEGVTPADVQSEKANIESPSETSTPPAGMPLV